ncbi:MAG: ABC transporter substrate-binding protein [Dehalococcoidia bacterium]|nr:ABC transporter substrate-binding protein [Dehalococcoidia bacterium]
MTPALLTPSRPLVAPPEDATRREFISGVGAAALAAAFLAACGEDEGDADAGSATWTYESEFGPVELPRTIERVVSIDYYTPPAMIDLGVVPVGVVNEYLTDVGGDAIPAEYQQAVIDGGAQRVSMSGYWETDIEAVAAAEPDLIIATTDVLALDAPTREQLEQIAPVVTFTARRPGSWLTRADGLATILGREDEVARLRAEYEEYRDELRERYAGLFDGLTFAVAGFLDDQWGVYAKGHWATEILLDLGAHFIDEDVSELQSDENGFPTWLSYEQLHLLNDADVILRATNADAAFAAVEANPLWKTLPAVQRGRVFSYINFTATGSYGWAMQNLQDFDQILAEVQSHLDTE